MRPDKWDAAEEFALELMVTFQGKVCPYKHLILCIILQAARDRDYSFLTLKNDLFNKYCELIKTEPEIILEWINSIRG